MEELERIDLNQLREQYRSLGKLGSGQFGSVLLYESRTDLSQYALKIVRCDSTFARNEARQ